MKNRARTALYALPQATVAPLCPEQLPEDAAYQSEKKMVPFTATMPYTLRTTRLDAREDEMLVTPSPVALYTP